MMFSCRSDRQRFERQIVRFGDLGRHARAAVGSVALPLGATVEVEMIAELD